MRQGVINKYHHIDRNIVLPQMKADIYIFKSKEVLIPKYKHTIFLLHLFRETLVSTYVFLCR